MKRIFFVAFTLLITGASFSQGNINKGNWMVGGDVNFSSAKYADADNSYQQFQFSPDFGYFFINQLAGGLRVDLNSNKYESLGEVKNTHFMIAPFLRYYFLPSSQKVNVFADAGYGFGKVKNTNATSEQEYNISGFAGKAGVAIFVVPSVAVEFSLSYTSEKEENISKRYNTVLVGAGFQIHLAGKK